MLILKKQNESIDFKIDIDEYVPFTIEVNSKYLSPQLLYWRVGDGESSLLEIGLNKENGAFCTATLSAINPKNIEESKQPINTSLPEFVGMASFDISDWSSKLENYSNNFQDEFSSDISLILGEDYMTLSIKNVGIPISYIRNGQLRFGITSNGMLSTLDIIDLNTNQIEILKLAKE